MLIPQPLKVLWHVAHGASPHAAFEHPMDITAFLSMAGISKIRDFAPSSLGAIAITPRQSGRDGC